MSDWWIDEEPYPGPCWTSLFITHPGGFKELDRSNLIQRELTTWDAMKDHLEYKPGDVYVEFNQPVGVVISIMYQKNPWRLVLELQPW